MVRFQVIPIVAKMLVVFAGVLSVNAAGLPSSGDKSSVGRCYAWKMRVTPAAPESTTSTVDVVETIISSRCKTEIPACRVVMEVICNGEVSEVESTDECIPCAVRKCQEVIPVCRFVSRAYRKGDCETSEAEPCLAAMRRCSEVERLRERYMPDIQDMCRQSAGEVDLRVRVEPTTPLEE